MIRSLLHASIILMIGVSAVASLQARESPDFQDNQQSSKINNRTMRLSDHGNNQHIVIKKGT